MLYIKHIILLLFNCRCDSFVFRLPPPRWSYKRFCLSVYIILFQLLLLLHIVAVAISSSIPFKFPAFPLAASAFLSFPSFYRNIICLCFFLQVWVFCHISTNVFRRLLKKLKYILSFYIPISHFLLSMACQFFKRFFFFFGFSHTNTIFTVHSFHWLAFYHLIHYTQSFSLYIFLINSCDPFYHTAGIWFSVSKPSILTQLSIFYIPELL